MRELIRVATEARSKNATPSEDTYNYNKEKNTIDIDAYIKRVKKFIKKSDNSFSDDPQEINSSVDVDDEPIENSTHQTHEVSNARPKKSHRQISLQIIAGKVKTQKKVRNLKEV